MNKIKKIDRLFKDSVLFVIDIMKFILYKSIVPFLLFTKPNEFRKEILLVKTDEIGDYILFRNILAYIKDSKFCEGYKIILCGNQVWKNIAESLDINFVDEFIWLNKKKFSTNINYRIRFLKEIADRRFEISINCSYSRSFYFDDEIVRVTNSLQKVGFKTDLSNSYNWQIKLSDKYYSKLINAESVAFEFQKNKILLEKLFDIKIPLELPKIDPDVINSAIKINDRYAVIFIGGRRSYKRWDIKNFIEVSKYLVQNYDLKILLVGSSSELKLNNKFLEEFEFKNYFLNYTNKTSLTELIKLIGNADVLIANDSGLVHIAASLGTRTIVLTNGTHKGRFLPYPENNKNKLIVIYPSDLNIKLIQKNIDLNEVKYRSLYDINKINFSQVIKNLDELISC